MVDHKALFFKGHDFLIQISSLVKNFKNRTLKGFSVIIESSFFGFCFISFLLTKPIGLALDIRVHRLLSLLLGAFALFLLRIMFCDIPMSAQNIDKVL